MCFDKVTCTPHININGTSAASLIEDHTKALAALDAALEAMKPLLPHGRDWQSAPEPKDYLFARVQHVDRVRRLHVIRYEVEQIALGIQEQMKDIMDSTSARVLNDMRVVPRGLADEGVFIVYQYGGRGHMWKLPIKEWEELPLHIG